MRRFPRFPATLTLILLAYGATLADRPLTPRDLNPEFRGARDGAPGLLEGGRPTALAAGDFDEDGMTDLAIATTHGTRGAVAFLAADPDAVYPFAPGARNRGKAGRVDPSTPSPFRGPGRVFEIASPADFLGAGDFDNDGHLDLIVAAAGGRALLLLKGDGHGGFAEPEERALPGRLNRMVVGEINHPDSLADIVVAFEEGDRNSILVLEGPEGAWKADAEIERLPGSVTTLALGDLDGDFERDLVVGVDRGLEVLHGRDRKLSLGTAARATVAPARLEHHALDFTPRHAAVGRFGDAGGATLALVGDDGDLRLSASGTIEKGRTARRGRSGRLFLGGPRADQGGTDLLTWDEAGRTLDALGVGPDAAVDQPEVALPLEAEPADLLAMRLGPEAGASLVLLNGDGPALLTIIAPAVATTYTVTTIADSGAGSLRQAILNANANPGTDTIAFNITPTTNLTIAPTTPLPDITDPATIDATTQPGYAGTPIVEIDGSGPLPSGTSGLTVHAGQSVVRGLVLRGFSGSGLVLQGAGHSIVEGNFLGLDHTGTVAIGNLDAGVVVQDSLMNTIGGTSAAARNVISGNAQAGVAIRGPSMVPLEYPAQGSPVGICDYCTVSMPITVTDEKLIVDIDVRVNLTHTYDSDLVLTLVAPDATRIVLSRNHGGNGDNYDGTVFDDGAAMPIAAGVAPFSGAYTPDEPLSILNGRSLTGTWSLEVADTAGGDVGTILGWSLGTVGETTYGNVVAGNLIGTDLTGTLALGNGRGVVVDQAPQNLIGGTVPGARNIIAGGTIHNVSYGVYINGWPRLNATHNTLQGNFIGTDITGTRRLKNDANGIDIASADACQIGGTAAGAGNLISGNGLYGVHLATSAASRIQGNIIGPDITATVPMTRDSTAGIMLDYNATGTLVGGSVTAARNIISGNGNGIRAVGLGGTFPMNSILGNYIGTDPTGTVAVSNAGSGIIVNSPYTQIGGPGAGEGNLVSANNEPGCCGIALSPNSASCTVQGNIVGLDRTGTVPLGNDRGVLINGGVGNLIGGTNPGEANVIAGNHSHGVWIYDPFNNPQIEGDGLPGLLLPLPDLATTTSVIQTPSSPNKLLVSVKVQVSLSHTFDSDLILTLVAPNGTRITLANRRGGSGDNYVTTVFDDAAPTPISLGVPPFNGAFQPEEPLSTLSGIGLAGPWTLEIADVAGGDSGTLVSWSLEFTYIWAYQAHGSQLVGNFIGTNALGAAGLGNAGDGIFGEFSNVLQIGSIGGGGNVVSGNAGHGIYLNANFFADNVVQSNLIGLKPDGVTPLGNGSDGILVSGPVGLIGGPGAAYGNRIAWNAGAGVSVSGSAGLRQTTIRANSIYQNGGLGIDLAPIGVTPNDLGDGDGGANQMQNYPIVTDVVPSFMNSLLISGTLQSRPSSKYIIDVYGSPQADPSGYGEGRTWLGTATVTSDVSGNASWTILTQNGNVGVIAATATDFAGNTSEFSGLKASPQEASPSHDMRVATGPANSVQITYTPACGATDHTLYWGVAGPNPIGPGGVNWSSAVCALGTSGSTNVLLGNPPAGQVYYFVVVGQNGSVEGSYGQNSTGAERPEATFPAICKHPLFVGGGCF